MSSTLTYYLAFQKIGIGAGTLRRLRETLPDIGALWNADRDMLRKTGASERLITELMERRRTVDFGRDITPIERSGYRCIALDDPAYPALLGEIHSPPLVLFVRGNVAALSSRCISVVGTRTPTAYGISATRRITEPVASRGVTIVSGLAYGIDAEAHRAALEAGGHTVAVLGNGIDTVYPRVHAELAEKMLTAGGAVLSEYPPRTDVQRHFFPQRNRIIAGLSAATVIVEAGMKSGALITARAAIDENRDVFAVPGPIDADASAGPNTLIKEGASAATSADDILQTLGLDVACAVPQNTEIAADTDDEMKLLMLLASPRHIDELVAMSTLDTSVVNAALSLLELKGRVRHLGGMHYQRI